MNWTNECFGAALIAAAGALIVVPVELWARHSGPRPEVARKLLHCAGTLPCLFIPTLIHSTAVAIALALALAAGLWAGTRSGLLSSVSGVARQSHGAVYYPLAILGVFLLAGDRTWMFLSAMLAFGVADAGAALVGSSYGRRRYEVEDDEKSLEGSLVFFVITFAAVALPLHLMADLPWPNCMFAALLTAALATGFEAVSLRGFDNLFVPIGVCLILDRIVNLPLQDLVTKNLTLFGLLAGFGVVARLTRQISHGAAIVLVLFTYVASALAEWHWALAPAIGFVLYVTVRIAVPPPRGYRTRVRVVVIVRFLIPALLLIALANAAGNRQFLEGPYLACFAAAMCFAVRVYLGWSGALPSRLTPWSAALAGAVIGGAFTAPLWLLRQAPIPGLVAISATCALLMIIHEFTLPRDAEIVSEDFWTAPRFLLSCAAALIIVGLQSWSLIPPWPEIVQLGGSSGSMGLFPD